VRRKEELSVGEAPRPTHSWGVRPTRAEIDLGAITANARALAGVVGPEVATIAVVKADAYGHGAVPVARALVAEGVRALAVSLVEEGLELRRAGVRARVLVMGGVYAGAHRDVVANRLEPVLSDLADVRPLARAAAAAATRLPVHLKVDTGMSRLGVRAEDVGLLLDAVLAEPSLEIVGFCTHLASADSDPEMTRHQLGRFEQSLAQVRARAGDGITVHVANSAGTLGFPESRYDAIRPGLALYTMTRPAMRFVTAIAQLRDVRAGETVSYGGLWKAARPTRIATLPVGYADGYPRRLSSNMGRADVLVGGVRCPIVGAICMDMTMIDVTDVPARVGDDVTLLGGSITARELAERAGLIEYEIMCGVSKRVPRVYAQG
jgi:alanine racemase